MEAPRPGLRRLGASGPGANGIGERGAEALNPMLRPPTHVVSKHKSLCPVDGCTRPRKVPSGNNRLPLTCPAHAGALSVPLGGVPTRECQACRTFHDLSAFDRDNKTCETRLLRKKLRYRARTLATLSEDGDRTNAEPKPEKPGPGRPPPTRLPSRRKRKSATSTPATASSAATAARGGGGRGHEGRATDGADQGGAGTAAAGRKRAPELDAETAAVPRRGPGPRSGGPGGTSGGGRGAGRPPSSKNKTDGDRRRVAPSSSG